MSKVYNLLTSWDSPGDVLFCFALCLSFYFYFIFPCLSFQSFEAYIGTVFLQMIRFTPSSLQSQVSHTSCKLYQLTLLGSKGSQILSSHTVNLNFNLRSFPVGLMYHLHVEFASSYYLWKVSNCLALLDGKPHQGRICWLTHHCIPRT